jgi:hypothetical protein
MKKTVLLLGAFLFANTLFSQFLTTGTLSTDNKYRSGGIAIGFTSTPTFGTNKFMVNGDSFFSGNIGIGTSNPLGKLHIPFGNFKIDAGRIEIGSPIAHWGDLSVNWGLKSSRSILVQSSQQDLFSEISVFGLDSGIQMAISNCNGCYSQKAVVNDVVIRGNTSGNFIICNEQAGGIKFETLSDATDGTTQYFTSKTQMLIDKNGSIGIGTGDSNLNPLEKLAVNGLIHTKEVKVDLLNWPDYVFKSDYNLPSLKMVENQIKEQGHLSNIPSAQDVETNGVLLGEMNKKLLEKVEELTLYLIQLNKDVEVLKNKLNKI